MILFTAKSYQPAAEYPLVATDRKRRPFALGLTWVDAQSEKDARRIARDAKAMAYCFLPKLRQVGLTSHRDQYPRRPTYTAAGAAAGRDRHRRWAGLYLVPPSAHFDGHYWCIEINDGKIVKDAVLSYDDALSECNRLLKEHDRLLYASLLIDDTLHNEPGSVGHEQLSQIIGADPAPLLTLSRSRLPAAPQTLSRQSLPLWSLGAVAIAAAGATWGLTQFVFPAVPKKVVEFKERRIEIPVPVVVAPRTVIDPAAFLIACQAALARLSTLGDPLAMTGSCKRPTGQAMTWTAQALFPAASLSSVTAIIAVAPEKTVSGNASGIVPDAVVSALKNRLASIVKIDTQQDKPAASAPAGAPKPPAAGPGVSLTTLTDGSLGSVNQALQTVRSPVEERSVTHVTLETDNAPSAWADRVRETPLDLEEIIRLPSGLWRIKGQLL